MERENIAKTISTWTEQAGSMLPKTPEQIIAYLESGTGVVIWDGGGKPVAFGAVTFEWPDNWKEIGGIVVDPDKRKHGMGHQVVAKIISVAQAKFPGAKFFALCNEKSLQIFLDNGGEVITDPEILPSEVFGECIHCPKFAEAKSQGKLCCDTPVLIKKKKSKKEEPLGCHR